MKILVIGKNSHLKWDTNVVQAFENLGHDVLHFQINKRSAGIQLSRGLFKAIFGKKIGNKFSNKFHLYRSLNVIKEFNPDLVFFVAASFIPEEYYLFFKENLSKSKFFAWEGDGGSINSSLSYLSKYLDFYFDASPDGVKKSLLGIRNIDSLSFSANINVFRNYNYERQNKTYFCGNLNTDRNDFISKLYKYELILKGFNWDKLNATKNNFIISNRLVNQCELISDYNSYISGLNITQKEVSGYSSGLNMRGFEIPSCGMLLINDYRENLGDYFDLENEICMYHNIEELKTILDKLSKYPKEFEKIRLNGYKRVVAEHSYEHRMKKVLEVYSQF